MAVIRCPNCGRPNPDFLEACQYCDQPLQATEAAPAASPSAVEDADAPLKPGIMRCPHCGKPNPDFLELCQFCENPLRGEAAPAAAVSKAAAEPAEDLPDWLKSLQTPEAEAEAPAAPPEVNNDWYWGGQSAVPAEPLPPVGGLAAAPAPEEDIPDWLKSMQAQAAAEPESAAPPAFTAPTEDADAAPVPDWLKSMQAEATPEPEPSAPAAFTFASPAEEAAPGKAAPDWLRGMLAPPSIAETVTPTSDLPDWLKSEPGAAPAPVTPAPTGEDVPDWLKSMAPPAETAAPTGSSAGQDELPDWLQAATGPLTGLPPSVTGPSALSGMPPAEPARSQTSPFSLPGDTPDWMRELGGGVPASPSSGIQALSTDVPVPAIMPGPEDSPDFLSAATSTPDEEAPEWLSAFGLSAAGAAAVEAGAPAFEGMTPPSNEPDWMKDLGSGPAAPPPATALDELAGLSAPSGEEPDWLKTLRTETPSPDEAHTASTGASISPFATDYEPAISSDTGTPVGTEDWLAALRPAEPMPFEEGQPAETPSDLDQADLPNWLAAMRPVDVQRPALAPEVDDYQETIGVLAGMRGVLRAEPSVVLPGRTAVNVHSLAITDAQTKQARLLTDLLQREAIGAPTAKRRRLQLSALPWERLLLAALLVLGMLAPLMVSPPLFLLPDPTIPLTNTIRPETLAAYRLVEEQLPAFKQVQAVQVAEPALVVFDYEPAQSGELRPGAEVVVEHLMRRGVPIVTLSTNLVGGNLAQDLVAERLAGKYHYNDRDHYLNLGYLPGGPIGILQFADHPRNFLRADFAGRSDVWTSPVLQPVDSLRDFGALVLISATPDSARAWIEQTQMIAPAVPVILVTSAGADPLLRPYVEMSGSRIKGMLSGRIGAAQYEVQANLRGEAADTLTWQLLGSGLLTAALLLVAGNVVHGVMRLVRRRKG